MNSNSKPAPNQCESTSDSRKRPATDELTTQQRDFANLVGRLLAELWESETAASVEEPKDKQ
jgi:hypothetical protein